MKYAPLKIGPHTFLKDQRRHLNHLIKSITVMVKSGWDVGTSVSLLRKQMAVFSPHYCMNYSKKEKYISILTWHVVYNAQFENRKLIPLGKY